MYGLVNRAIQKLVTTQFGADAWEAIKAKAGIDIPLFVGMKTYPDEVTYGLVDAASEVLGLPPEKVLEAFGEYWILYTAKEGYGDLLRMSGDSLVAFLQNMDGMHARVGMAMPELRPPSFACTDVTAAGLRLHYRSERPGLAPMVVGLLRGLGTTFGTPVEVVHDVARGGDGRDHDEFVIRFVASG